MWQRLSCSRCSPAPARRSPDERVIARRPAAASTSWRPCPRSRDRQVLSAATNRCRQPRAHRRRAGDVRTVAAGPRRARTGPAHREERRGPRAWMDKLLPASRTRRHADRALRRHAGAGRTRKRARQSPSVAGCDLCAGLREEDRRRTARDRPANAAYNAAKRARRTRALSTLDSWIARIATIPPAARHDLLPRRVVLLRQALWHARRRRDRTVTRPEPSAGALQRSSPDARRHHVHAVFAEPQFSRKLADELASSAGIQTVTDLYDDTLGTTPELATYDG